MLNSAELLRDAPASARNRSPAYLLRRAPDCRSRYAVHRTCWKLTHRLKWNLSSPLAWRRRNAADTYPVEIGGNPVWQKLNPGLGPCTHQVNTRIRKLLTSWGERNVHLELMIFYPKGQRSTSLWRLNILQKMFWPELKIDYWSLLHWD